MRTMLDYLIEVADSVKHGGTAFMVRAVIGEMLARSEAIACPYEDDLFRVALSKLLEGETDGPE